MTLNNEPAANSRLTLTAPKAAETIEHPTIFDELNQDCLDALLDWLPLKSLCSFSKTCKSLQKTCKHYFARKYQSQELTVGDEFVFDAQRWECFRDVVLELRLYDSNIRAFAFAGSAANTQLRGIALDRTFKEENDITNKHIDEIKSVLKNVKTVRAVDCAFSDGSAEYLLGNCPSIEDLAFTVSKNHMKNRLHLRKYPTLRNIEIHFHSKANVVKAIKSIREENLHLDELVLMFRKEHSDVMVSVFDELHSMHFDGHFKRLYLMFEKKSMVAEHIDRITTVRGLEGLTCSYTINTCVDNTFADICKLQNIKFLNINWLLGDAVHIAQELQQLLELEVSVISIDAIVSFVRFSSKLGRFHIEQIRANNNQCKINFDAMALNKERIKLVYARKLVIYIPEDKFIKLKWSSVEMNSQLVEIKREESCIPWKRNDTNVEKGTTNHK